MVSQRLSLPGERCALPPALLQLLFQLLLVLAQLPDLLRCRLLLSVQPLEVPLLRLHSACNVEHWGITSFVVVLLAGFEMQL